MCHCIERPASDHPALCRVHGTHLMVKRALPVLATRLQVVKLPGQGLEAALIALAVLFEGCQFCLQQWC